MLKFGQGVLGHNFCLFALLGYVIYLGGFANTWFTILVFIGIGYVINLLEVRIATGKWLWPLQRT